MADRMQVAAFEKTKMKRVFVAKRVGNERVVRGDGFEMGRHSLVGG